MKKMLYVLMIMIIFSGCSDTGLGIKVLFDGEIQLNEGDRILADNKQVGSVSKVSTQNNGNTLAEITIDKLFCENVTENSEFFIISDPQDEGKKAIDIVQSGAGGLALKDGVTVNGISNPVDQFWANIEKGASFIKDNFKKLTDDLLNLKDSDETKKLEKALTDVLVQLKQSGDSVKEKIEKEVMPQLKNEAEKLKKQIKNLGRKENLDKLIEKIDKIINS